MSRTRLPHNILDFKQFLLRRQVIYLYREVLKLIKEHKSLDQQRELKEWASYEFRSRKNLTDEGAVKMHLAKGRLAVKELAAAIRMAKDKREVERVQPTANERGKPKSDSNRSNRGKGDRRSENRRGWAAIRRMKNGEAEGPDNKPVEAWKVVGRTATWWLKQVFNDDIMEAKHMADHWRASTLIQIFKNKGNIQDCGNYQGIKLTSHTLKRVIDKRLRNGWKSTTDAIFALRQSMEKYREGLEKLHCIFIDLEKAYDRVPRQELWNCLRLEKVEEKYIRLVQDMYEDSKTIVKCTAGEEFEVTLGLHQGSALSPFLFAVIIDYVTGELQREAPWDMLFADDLVVRGKTKEEVEQRLGL
eukprot:gene17384-8979_t